MTYVQFVNVALKLLSILTYKCTYIVPWPVCVQVCTYMHTYTCTMYMYSSNKNFILDVGMEKEQKQELGWRVSVLPITVYCVLAMHIISHSSGMQEWVIQIPSIPILVSVLFPSLHLE